jgi:hypothetical protein
MKFTSTAILSTAVLAASVFSSPIDLEKRQPPQYYQFDDGYYAGGNSIGNTQLDYSKSSAPWTHLKNQGYNLLDKTESYTGVNGLVQMLHKQSCCLLTCHSFFHFTARSSLRIHTLPMEARLSDFTARRSPTEVLSTFTAARLCKTMHAIEDLP